MRIKSDLPPALKYQAVVVESAARAAGLDFFDVVFELLDARDVNGVAAYAGFPVRYPSWRFGMDYERLEKGYRWGLSKIYELVINNDPTYAYLVRSNSLLEQKLVMAHVYGHADFFKHNLWFAPTERNMLDVMSDHSIRVRRYMDRHGQEKVERFIDLALSVETLVDPFLPLRKHGASPKESRGTLRSERARLSLESLGGDAVLDGARRDETNPPSPSLPTHDIIGFLADHAPLERWQRDVLQIVRDEAHYFAPQRMTKVMNEGWASYWHSRLLTEGLLEASEIMDFADCHSGATASGPGQLNPYKLGIEAFRRAEAMGEDIFRLRRVHNDVTMFHKLVDEEFVDRVVAPMLGVREATAEEQEAQEGADWRTLKDRLLQQLSWGGLPQIELVDMNSDGDGELLLVHRHDGRDLKVSHAERTLLQVHALWDAPVHLLTVVEKQGRRLVARDGEVLNVDSREAERHCGLPPRQEDREEERRAG